MQIVEPMDAVEARGTLIAARGNLKTASELLHTFDERLGWKALGYADLDSCIQAEFGHPSLRAFLEHELDYSPSYSYRLQAVNEVAVNIQQHSTEVSPMGENPPVLRERWVRDSGLDKLPAPQQAEAYTVAVRTAETEGVKAPTARHFQQAVQQIKRREIVFQSTYHVVTQMVVTEAITPAVGQQMNDELEKLSPRRRSIIVQLLAKYGGPMPELFAAIAEKLDRTVGKESLVAPELLHGYIAGVPLAKATVRDLSRANLEAQRQHQAEAAELKRQAEIAAGKIPTQEIPTYVVMWDAEKTRAALLRDLGEGGMLWLLDVMLAG